MSMRTKPFSIYLLKNGYSNVNSIKDGSGLMPGVVAKSLPAGAQMYVADSIEREPWWKDYFEIEMDLKQSSKGALVFFPVEDRWFALTFGHVSHHLEDNSYEYDFGLRVTLNSLDPKALKSVDVLTPGISKRKRTQIPDAADLTLLDFDSDAEIVRTLTGSVKNEYSGLFKSATGSASLKVGFKVAPGELLARCTVLLGLYKSNDYEAAFPNVGKIAPEKDPDVVSQLNSGLLKKLDQRDDSVSLSIPDIVDYRDNTSCRFSGVKGAAAIVYPEVSIDSFYDYIGVNSKFEKSGIASLKGYGMALCDADGRMSRSFGLYSCLLADSEFNGSVYHLCEGSWYRVDKDYVNGINDFIDEKFSPIGLIEYSHDTLINGELHYSEEEYNKAASAALADSICLDQTDMSPDGSTQVEPCDIYAIEMANGVGCGVFYHLKISTRSSQLSHLFNQGANSAELIIGVDSCRANLVKLIKDKVSAGDCERFTSPVENGNFKVVFGIITRKDPSLKSRNIPLFSKISLMRAMKHLKLMRVASSVSFISDASKAKGKYSYYDVLIVEVVVGKGKHQEVVASVGQAIAQGTKVKGCPGVIRAALVGSKFKVFIQIGKDGLPYTNHAWDFEAA